MGIGTVTGQVSTASVAAETTGGDLKWTVETDGRATSAPTVVDGTVYVASGGSLYAIDAGVDGSSGGSRVRLGTLGHHHGWAEAHEEIGAVAGDVGSVDESTGDANSNETADATDDEFPGPGVLGTIASVGGAGYLLARRANSSDHSGDERHPS
ncbi:PQQ-binding-like beta-propeller repeat protein [Natronobeatus ordinarius]|uniref:PQQ-binding-like beta-propeller repeat protein n=1 Tax=Natronobeatus ordinarius TaxID=2963433 RepID=UPI0020CEEEE4|nr:PQQ-binding-like beta-propeller repeat protein [Natronobeatus ordinarius]